MLKKFLFVAVFSLFVLIASGCDTVSHSDEHAEVEGLVLVQSQSTVVTVADATVTGSLSVASGSTSPLFTIEWQDGEGNEVHSEDLGDEFTIGWVVSNESVASVTQSGRFGFTISGLAVGQTSIRIQLKHNDHPDFTTPDITVTVADAS